MSQLEIENSILRTLYEKWSQSDRTNNFHTLLEQTGLDENAFDKLMARMEHSNFLHEHGIGYTITPHGILYVEEKEIVPKELARRNRDARNLLLESLATIYDQEGPSTFTHYTELSNEYELDEELVLNNLELLLQFNCVEHPAVGCYRITQYGLERIEDYRRRNAIAEEFERISEMQPHPRGRTLQKLLANLFEHQGWSQLEGLRTSNEEMDLILYKGREYYFIECKWEKDPIETEVADKLIGKLVRRPDAKGIIISMSGFSKGIVKAVKDNANIRVILLFGPEDLRSIIYGQTKFEELLNEKYKQFVTRQEVVFA